jgi:hypothetical protein
LQQCTDALRVVGAGHKAGQLDTSTQIQATWCLAYVTGFADGHTVATVDAAMGSHLLCPPDGWRSAEQLAQILVEWLRTHPTQLHRDKNDLTLFAFADAFPCPSAVAAPPQQTPSIAPQPATPKAGKGK